MKRRTWNLTKVLCFFSYYGAPRNDDGSVRFARPILYSDAIMVLAANSSQIMAEFNVAVRRHFAAFSDSMVGAVPHSFWLDGYLPENGRRHFERT